MLPDSIAAPKTRSPFRRFAAREFFIFKRRWQWMRESRRLSREQSRQLLPHLYLSHRSLLLRPLKDVDMQLQHNKVTNLRLAIIPLDGLLIRPGESFSLWHRVGRPSRRKGYLEGLVLENGKIGRGTGGGLCQLGNLLYWMALHSPLQVTERWRHSFDVFPDVNRTIPFGCGATLAFNYVDLKLHNPTPHTFQLRLWLDETHLCGELRGEVANEFQYTVFETDHEFRQQWWGGYTRHNKIWKRVSRGDEEWTEPVAANHAIMMYNPLLGT